MEVQTVDLSDLKIAYPNIDFNHLIPLIDADKSSYFIAEKLNISQSTATRLIRKIRIKTGTLKEFVNDRSDILASLHKQSINIQERVYTYYECMDEKDFIDLKDQTKIGLLHTAGINANNVHAQERLERGKSTENIVNLSLIADINNLLEQLKQPSENSVNTELSTSYPQDVDK
jgi:hypothetical protein